MKKWMWAAIAVVIVAVAFGGWKWRSRSNEPRYREETVTRGDLETSILATGTVQPQNRLEIKPPVAGRVEEVLVEEGQMVKKGQILAWMSSAERAAMIDAARSKGTDEVKRWEDLYRQTPIVAPISGMIIKRAVESGQTFAATDAVLVMSDRLTVKAQIDETDLAQVRLNQKAEIRLDAYPEQKIPASIDQIAFEAKVVSNVTTYIVDVIPVHTPEFMRSGMTANVTFFVQSKKDALLIPTEFIKYDNGRAVVLVKGAEGNVERDVRLGASDGKQSEVLEGLKDGDVILVLRPRDAKPKAVNPFSPMGGSRGSRK